MEHGRQRGDRRGGPCPGGPHEDERLPPGLRGVRGEEEAGLRGGLMDRHGERLQWPFFGDEHRRLAAEAEDWAGTNLGDAAHPETRAAVEARCRDLVAALGKAGFL